MNYDAIDSFLKRVKQLSGKDMRLSFQEAQMLAISLAELMSQLNQQASLLPASSAIPGVIDGGTFKNRSD